jgi:peptidoglycan/xylan/chitin deacetylase (PgdA/CDA1 family)
MVAGLAGQASEWVRSHSHPRRLVDGDELRQLAEAGVGIGSHTDTHVRLGECDAATARRELHDSRARLEDLLGRSVDHFAYPYGSLARPARDAVEEAGYRSGGSREPGRNGRSTDRFVLRRVGVGGPLTLRQFDLKLRFGLEETAPKRVARATAKRALQLVGARPTPGRA